MLVGPGDDGAVLDLRPPVVTSLDVLVEGVHFRRDWSPARDVGRKAVAVNVSDLEAMGARATALVVGFSAPPSLELSWALDFAAGLTEEAAAAGVSLVGGDVTRARDITISVTVLGTLDGRAPVLRSGARSGDVVAVLRSAGLGGGRARRARPRVPLAARGGGGAPGAPGQLRSWSGGRCGRRHRDDRRLGRAAGRPRPSSRRRPESPIDLDRTAFEIADPLQAVAAATGTDPYTLVLTGGEDHALAATFADTAAVPDGWSVVGRVRRRRPRIRSVLVDGAPWEAAAGFDHFRGPSLTGV